MLHEKRQHIVRLEKRKGLHIATCSCGWSSSIEVTKSKADKAGDDHIMTISWCTR